MHLNALECYTCICLGYGISHDVSDVAAQQVSPERLGDSRSSEQGLSLPNKTVQRSLVRHNTAPLHRPPSPSARRRHTICNGSGMYLTLSYSHNCTCTSACTRTGSHAQTYTLAHTHTYLTCMRTHTYIHSARYTYIYTATYGTIFFSQWLYSFTSK